MKYPAEIEIGMLALEPSQANLRGPFVDVTNCKTLATGVTSPFRQSDIAHAFTTAGACVVHVRSLKAALVAAEDTTLSAAIIERVLSDGDSTGLCARLSERKILCVVDTGYPKLEKPLADVLHVLCLRLGCDVRLLGCCCRDCAVPRNVGQCHLLP
jgi:hypothetical protein